MLNKAERALTHKLCEQAYSDDHPDLFRFGGVEVIIQPVPSEQKCYIVFRGSRGWPDWRRNFRFRSKRTDFGKVHGGYWKEASQYYKDILAVIPDSYQLIWGGHSRGGMAQLFAALVHCEIGMKRFKGGICFGNPKIFKGDLKRIPKFENCINKSDFVTRTPFWGGWKHYGKISQKNIKVKGSEHPIHVYSRWL